ncbi:MAG: hypothetical protein DI533_12570 [Cereibacter sphaeroides]|uniref:Uncharacterized protein n=1 Tax=Cereibacter sphaeroides TaxID=1063 RepID=A0A2W5UJ48_CERSP|nr:MAG: hypothetical protein DI533_12570 [Cereibacter sphaeroides]
MRLLPLFACLAIAAPVFADPVKELPLKRGFYVSSDTPCGQASNATLSAVTRKGISYAQAECIISAIDRTAPTRFDVTDSCTEIATGNSLGENTTTYDIPDDQTYVFIAEGAPSGGSRYCAQNELPEPWAHNDVSQLFE